MVRILYDHQVFSLQNAGGASRYFYELLRFMTAVPDVQTELLLGISGTVYPFRELDRVQGPGHGGWEVVPPGSLRYVANEAWSNLVASLAAKWTSIIRLCTCVCRWCARAV